MHLTSNFILPVLTWLLGVVSSILVVWYSSRSTLRREYELKAIERREGRLMRRNEFQRETLLALQEAAAALVEAVIEDMKPGEGKVRSSISAEAASFEYRKNTARIELLMYRVHDEGVRSACRNIMVACLVHGYQRQSNESTDAMDLIARHQNELNEAIYPVLISLDALDDQV